MESFLKRLLILLALELAALLTVPCDSVSRLPEGSVSQHDLIESPSAPFAGPATAVTALLRSPLNAGYNHRSLPRPC